MKPPRSTVFSHGFILRRISLTTKYLEPCNQDSGVVLRETVEGSLPKKPGKTSFWEVSGLSLQASEGLTGELDSFCTTDSAKISGPSLC